MKIRSLLPMDVTGNNHESTKDQHGCINPFRQDLMHMGTIIGRNVTIMHMNFETEECERFVVVNTRTGECIEIDMEAKCAECGTVGHDARKYGQVTMCPNCISKKCHE